MAGGLVASGGSSLVVFLKSDRKACVMVKPSLGEALWLLLRRSHYLITHCLPELALCPPGSGGHVHGALKVEPLFQNKFTFNNPEETDVYL